MLRFRQYLIFNYVKKLCTQFLLEVNLKALSRVKNTNGLINFNVRLEEMRKRLLKQEVRSLHLPCFLRKVRGFRCEISRNNAKE